MRSEVQILSPRSSEKTEAIRLRFLFLLAQTPFSFPGGSDKLILRRSLPLFQSRVFLLAGQPSPRLGGCPLGRFALLTLALCLLSRLAEFHLGLLLGNARIDLQPPLPLEL